jgi:ribokinase
VTGRIVVIGGLNMDIHLFGLRESAGQAPVVAERHLAQPGGKGGNVARAAARLGASVRLVARVGDDDFGRHCVDAVAGDGVDIAGVRVSPGEATGFVAIELTEGKHRSLVFSPGANDLLTWDDVAPHVADLGAEDVLVAQVEMPPATLSALSAHLAGCPVPLFLDPTPPDRVRREHLVAAHVITPDLVEAAQLTGRRDDSRFWPQFAAGELRASGARRVLLKTGEAGALLLDDDGLREIPTVNVAVLDETGAGDVFLGALAVRRLEGADWDQATRFANAAAALSVSRDGLALPDHREVTAAAAGLGPTVSR